MSDGHAPSARLEFVEDPRSPGLPREDAKPIGPHDCQRLWLSAVEPARPADSLSECPVGDLFDRDGYASQDVFECVAGSKASAVHDPSSDAVEGAMHQTGVKSGNQQLRMSEAMSQADRVRECRPRLVVVGFCMIMVHRVAAVGIRGHQDCHAGRKPS